MAGFSGRLIDAGLLTRQDLAAAESHARQHRLPLPDAVVAAGYLSEIDSYCTLALSAKLPIVDLDEVSVSELGVRLIPERLARGHSLVPIDVTDRMITCATAAPFDPDAEPEVGFAAGRRPRFVIAARSAIERALDRCYPRLHELNRLATRLQTERPLVEDSSDIGPGRNEPTVIDLCNQLIGRAVDLGASDVHIECTDTGAQVKYRISGVLEPVLTLSGTASLPIRNRFKVMARADIAARHRPQDGAFFLKVNGRRIDVRLSSLPTVEGEKLVMRVIDGDSPLQSLERLGYPDHMVDRLRRCLARPDGLVLATGPTGSGKTTALYAALAHLRTGRTNIVSVEDPVERKIAGVTQVPVNSRAGNSYTTALRSILRQDPNVIMVGEIRDAEVAQIVGQAAYTGHLVLSSLHTPDAATAITRLTNLGLEAFKVAETLCGIVSQRLVRRLCPHCSVTHSEHEARRLGAARGVAAIGASIGPGCERCHFTGFAGREPVAELLTPDDQLREAITRGATAQEIRASMRRAGHQSMRDAALELVAAGTTTIEEVDRVLADEVSAGAIPSGTRRVLVTDDDTITRMLIKMLLERERFTVLEAANGRQAVDIATRERPDLVLIDLNMPEMDGYQAIARLRQDFTLTAMPILVLTAEEGPGVERRVIDLGADDYLVKPFDPQVLTSRVNAVFRRLKLMAA